jgi:2-keto-4-pentenoate hydratase/2-oxohepta-3-ene-1,7-dioic acid hydratase in catechol pathway
MKLVAFHAGAGRRLGFLVDEEVVDPLLALPENDSRRHWFADATAFIGAGGEGRALASRLLADTADAADAARLSLSQLRLAAPILPSTILASGSNYRAHNEEKANTPISGKEPEFFVMTADCVIGPDEGIVYDPELTQKLDVETELAVVIGTPGRHIPVERALEHVFGYTIVNDVTARDRQVRQTPEGFTWYEVGRGKAFDTSAPLGPCIVSADEIDPQALELTTRINGEVRQKASTADMIWTCAELVHFFSISFTLKPGMVISTGTPSGTAWSVDPELGGTGRRTPGTVPASRYCLPGDVVESEIAGIGILRNPVVELVAP